MKKNNKLINIGLIVGCIIFTLLVKFVDVSNIGPNDSSVGFSTINKLFHNIIGVHMSVYKISEICGYVPILIVVGYAVVGALQLIKRKSLFKVDKDSFLG